MRSTAFLLTATLLAALAASTAASPYGAAPARPTADYTYSYSSGVASGQETRAGSLTQGGFSYVDANGQVQSRRYVADGARGFLVTATDAQEPVQDTPEVARAKQEHLAAVARATALVSGGGVGVAAPQPVADTPEVAAARAHHLAIVQDVRARGASGVVSVTPAPAAAPWSTPSSVYAQQRVWTVSSTPAPVQDTVEVAAAKAKHFAAVQEANVRAAAASQQSYQQSGVQAYSSSQQHYQHSVSVTPSPVQETPEVAAAKAQHLAAVAQAAARVSSSNSIATGYAVPAAVPAVGVSRFHYPNVPADLAPRFPAPAPAPVAAWPAANVAAVRYNSIAAVVDESGRYVPDDEGQYDARLDAEGQYDARLDAEGHYIPSLNDEGQWVPSANEGQYVPGREDQAGEDNMPYSYSYSDGLSSKTETKTADGVTRGRFSYVDANGVLQAVQYEADNYNGFRASGTNLPQAPSSAPAAPGARIYHTPGPVYPVPAQVFQAPIAAYGVPSQPIHPRPIAAAYAAPAPSVSVAVPDVPADTPEVAAAKAAHFAAHREAGARLANAYSG